ncbi:hypothetical protein KC340_g11171 [Hortaea werneckii]|nr:hypothetical protein KC342_g11462 [Hortaea werneckii]KAI7084819.1 hypothetical protein KC339_g12999 [Hortaea werneckii]KAI7228982.1 hypothetical protein KC365_g8203 [Hortaea werneckii]KAI7308032.1 hypothetical protein KC340_g11171 [Hortaea werneckii]KAI7401557.1 hypothetical protein KC328_g3160 [Hortaea werneckii]
MAPKEKKESTSGFTARDLDLIAAAIQSTKAPVEIDYKVFAEKAGLGGAPSAKASWHGLKKKMEKLNGGGVAVASPGGTPNEKAEKGSKKRKVDDVDDEGGEGDGKEDTPTGKAAKKGRKAAATKAKGKKAAVVKAEAEEDEQDDGTPAPEGKDQDSGEADGEEKLEENATAEVGENIKVES